MNPVHEDIGGDLHENVANVEDTEASLVFCWAQVQVVFQAAELCSCDVVSV